MTALSGKATATVRISTAIAAATPATTVPAREVHRSSTTSVTSCAARNTHSDINVEVARKTRLGVKAVATATPSASIGPRRARANTYVSPAAANIAPTDSAFSARTFAGNVGAISQSGASRNA